jgi:hypothetical protein
LLVRRHQRAGNHVMSASVTTTNVPMMAAVSQIGSRRKLDLLFVIVVPPWMKLS